MRADLLFGGERDAGAFGAADDGAREVKAGDGDRSAGQDEARERGKIGVHRVNLFFEPAHLTRDDTQRMLLEIGSERGGDVGAEVEHLVLDHAQLGTECARRIERGDGAADRTIRFVDLADRDHSRP